jgi:predicted nucleic-acid-binding Zn-ribbon protein
MPGSSCPKCGGRLEAGFLLEQRDGNMKGVTEWIEGAPETGWFGAVKVRKKRHLPVQTLRCTRCGYLESYAPGA